MDEDNNIVKEEAVCRKTKTCRIQQRYVLAVIAFAGLCNGTFLRNSVSVAVLAMVNATHPNSTHTGNLNWNNAEEGAFLEGYFSGYSMGNFPAAWVVARYGCRNPYGVSMVICAIICILTPAAAYTSFYLAMSCRIITGLLQAVMMPAITDLWSRWAPPYERSILVSTSFSGYLGGYVMLFPTASVIIELISWEALFYITGGLTLLWSFFFFLFITDSPETHPRISTEERDYILRSIGYRKIKRKGKVPWKSMLTSKSVLGIICGHFADAWFQFCLAILLPTYLVDVLHFNIIESGLLLILPFLLQWFVALLSGQVTDALRERKLISTTTARKFNTAFPLVLGGFLIVLCSYVEDNGSLVVGLFTTALCISGLTCYLTNFLDVAPRHASMLMGLSNSIGAAAGFLGPFLVGVIVTDKTQRSQWQVFFWITCGVCIFGGVAFALFASGVEQKWAKAEYNEEADSLKPATEV